MAEITVGNMQDNAALFMEKMGFMRSVMDDILGHGAPKVSM